jgi:signal transduction histidine kinase
MGDGKLSRKYAALTRKYEALVAQTVHARGERSWVSRLGAWALRGTSAALAVVQRGEVVIQNVNWLHLGRVRGWRSFTGEEPARRYDGLTQLTCEEAARLLERRVSTCSVRFIREDGAQIIKLRLEAVPEGREAAVLVLIDDVTREAAGELLALRATEHLRVLGELTAGIIHDLGNALHGMGLRIAASRKIAARPEVQAHLRALDEALQRCQETLQRGRKLALPGKADTDLRVMFDDIAEIMSISDKGLTLGIHGGRVGAVRGPAVELRHLFFNLVLNARDSMGGHGVVEVKLTRVARRARIEVRDQGPGFAADVLPRIFEPFFTTKASGMGLGLSLARSLVTSLGGTIRAQNARGGGARVTVELPLTSARAPARSPTPEANAARSRPSASAAPPARAPRRQQRARRSARRSDPA